MSRSGFFLVYRKLFDHEIANNPLVVALWVKLLADATWEDKTIFWEENNISIKRGQLITSIEKLAKWLKLARSTTKQLLIRLQNIQQIDIKTTNKYTIITIKNYNKYQTPDNKTTSDLSTDRHQTDTKKEYKETKELKEKREFSKNEIIQDPDFKRLLTLKGSLDDGQLRMKMGLETALGNRYPAWKFESQWREAMDFKRKAMN